MQLPTATQVPFLHIADSTGEMIRRAGATKVGLLGTRFTMEQDFYRQRLVDKYGLEVHVPPLADRDVIHAVIYDELCLGKVVDRSRQEYLRIIDGLAAQGVQGVVLGCTEITLLIGPNDTRLPLFDTTRIHCEMAVDYALRER